MVRRTAALKRGLNTVGEGAKADIIKKVVSKVEVHPDSATIYYRVSKGETLPPEVAPLGEPKATSQLPGAGKGQKEKTPTFFKNPGSTTCLFGGGKRSRTADLLHAMQALYQLSYTPK